MTLARGRARLHPAPRARVPAPPPRSRRGDRHGLARARHPAILIGGGAVAVPPPCAASPTGPAPRRWLPPPCAASLAGSPLDCAGASALRLRALLPRSALVWPGPGHWGRNACARPAAALRAAGQPAPGRSRTRRPLSRGGAPALALAAAPRVPRGSAAAPPASTGPGGGAPPARHGRARSRPGAAWAPTSRSLSADSPDALALLPAAPRRAPLPGLLRPPVVPAPRRSLVPSAPARPPRCSAAPAALGAALGPPGPRQCSSVLVAFRSRSPRLARAPACPPACVCVWPPFGLPPSRPSRSAPPPPARRAAVAHLYSACCQRPSEAAPAVYATRRAISSPPVALPGPACSRLCSPVPLRRPARRSAVPAGLRPSGALARAPGPRPAGAPGRCRRAAAPLTRRASGPAASVPSLPPCCTLSPVRQPRPGSPGPSSPAPAPARPAGLALACGAGLALLHLGRSFPSGLGLPRPAPDFGLLPARPALPPPRPPCGAVVAVPPRPAAWPWCRPARTAIARSAGVRRAFSACAVGPVPLRYRRLPAGAPAVGPPRGLHLAAAPVPLSARPPLWPVTTRIMVGSPTMTSRAFGSAPSIASTRSTTAAQPTSSSKENASCSGRLSGRLDARAMARKRQRVKALHVAGAATVEFAVAFGQRPGIGCPGLPLHRHHVGVARKDDPAIDLGAGLCIEMRLRAARAHDPLGGNAILRQIGFDPLHKRQIAVSTD